jgi:hypothetical protein
MSLDQHLPDALRRAADEHTPPIPDLTSLVGGGRRRKRRRDVRRVAVAAACLAVVGAVPFVAGTLRTTDSTPPVGEADRVVRVTELPVGDTPAIPYCTGNGTIVGAGAPIQAECDVLIHRGASTVYLDARGVNLLADGQRTLLDPRGWSSWFPAVSLDGRWAAWVTETPDHDALLLGFDLRTGEQVAEEPWPTSEGWVAGIDDLGRVYFQSYGTPQDDVRVFDLRTGDSYQVTGVPIHPSPSIKFVTSDGFGTYTYDSPLRNDLGVVTGSVAADGTFTQQRPAEQDWGSGFSPDRSLAVFERRGQLVVSPTTGTGSDVQLQLPTHGEPVWFPVWESPETVLVQFDPVASGKQLASSNGYDYPAGRTWLLRCHVADGTCEVALQAGWTDNAEWPIYR